jgi:PAS domain S-box-containing protein
MGRWLQQFFGTLDSDMSEPLRVRLFRLMCLTTGVVCLPIVLPMNLFQHLPVWVNIADTVLGLFGLACYWASMRGRHLYLTFFLVLMVLLDSVWNLNAGSEGSITYYFFPAILYPLAILRGRTRWLLVGLVVVNACGLLVLEYFHPDWTTPFLSRTDRLNDLVTGVIGSAVALAAVIWLILQTYDREQLRLSRYAQALAASEQKFRGIFNSTSDALLVRDAAGRLIDANDRMLEMFGYARDEVAALSTNDLCAGVSPYSGREAQQVIERAEQGGPQVVRWLSKRKNGEVFWCEVTLHFAEIMGQRRRMVSIRDITTRVRNEEALRAQEERLRLALAASLQGWFEINVQTGAGLSSEEYVRIIGYEPAEFVTTLQGWLEGIHPEDRQLAREAYQGCVAAGDSRTLEYRRRTKTGDWKWIRSIGRIVEYDAAGKPLRMVGTHTDITERKELEARLLHSQRLEAVGTLAAGVAHDLNNILTPMLMVPAVLGDKLAEPKDRELMALLAAGAKRGAAIVRQLLTFSRDMAQSRVPVDPGHLVREMGEIVRATFPPNIKVVVQVPESLWSVTADPIQLHQVLMNLCVNARDAMPGGGTLKLAVENSESTGESSSRDPWAKGSRRVVLTVTDTGHGIPPEIRDRIFDPFFTTKDVGKGTGLGLSTVYGIVKGYGGAVTVDSRPNQGATFKVVLPADAPGPG